MHKAAMLYTWQHSGCHGYGDLNLQESGLQTMMTDAALRTFVFAFSLFLFTLVTEGPLVVCLLFSLFSGISLLFVIEQKMSKGLTRRGSSWQH